MYYFFEIYTKHPIHKTSGWDIQAGWVEVEKEFKTSEEYKAAVVDVIKKNIKNFDKVINIYRGNPRASDLDLAENIFLIKIETKVTEDVKKNIQRKSDVLAKPKVTKTKTKWTEELVLEVIGNARRLGAITAADKLTELSQAGPKYTVHDENRNNRCVGTMLDVCGFANLRISARGKFFQLAKKLAATGQYRFYCTVAYRGGGHLSIYDSTNRQEMSVNKAACSGHAQALNAYGIETSIETRID